MLTKLVAINKIMGAVGVGAVTDAESTHPDAIAARLVLDTVSMSIQARGGTYNTDTRTLSLDNDGQIILASNTLRVDAVDKSKKVSVRGTKLYNKETGTFIFSSSIKCVIRTLLEYDNLPFHAANLIMYKSALDHFIDQDGDGTKLNALNNRANEAQILYEKVELESADTNALQSPHALEMLGGIHQYSSGRNPNLIGG